MTFFLFTFIKRLFLTLSNIVKIKLMYSICLPGCLFRRVLTIVNRFRLTCTSCVFFKFNS